jgi:hypothetical protein
MDVSQFGFWIAILFGGVIIASLSAYQQYGSDEFRVKPVIRDFCIGAFLTATVYMFIPDTIQELISSSQSTMASILPTSSPSPSSVDIELHTGPARF